MSACLRPCRSLTTWGTVHGAAQSLDCCKAGALPTELHPLADLRFCVTIHVGHWPALLENNTELLSAGSPLPEPNELHERNPSHLQVPWPELDGGLISRHSRVGRPIRSADR